MSSPDLSWITPEVVWAARREKKRRIRDQMMKGLFAPVADDGLPVRFRVAKGGRGSGKSHCFAEALIERAAQKKTRILCAREIQKSIRDSVKALLTKKIKELGYESEFNVLDTEIRHSNGSLITFVGLRSNIESEVNRRRGHLLRLGGENSIANLMGCADADNP